MSDDDQRERLQQMQNEAHAALLERLAKAQRFDREPNGVPPRITPAKPDYFTN